MEPMEAVRHLARQEARRLRPARDPSELAEPSLPYFRVSAPLLGTRAVEGCNHAGHDNEDRMPLFCDLLLRRILPSVEPGVKLSYCYSLELHDSHSYLGGGGDPHSYLGGGGDPHSHQRHRNCLVFSRPRDDRAAVLLPDLYHLTNYGPAGLARDPLPYRQKPDDRVAFWGTTTGDRDPRRNARVRACVWSLPHPGQLLCRLTRLAQMSVADAHLVPQACWAPYAPTEASQRHKLLLDVPGNTCSWDRVPNILASRSVLLMSGGQDMCFYYPLLHAGAHYVPVALEEGMRDLLSARARLLALPGEAEAISARANLFAETFLRPGAAAEYVAELLRESAHLHAP
jgi:hypothetical protein